MEALALPARKRGVRVAVEHHFRGEAHQRDRPLPSAGARVITPLLRPNRSKGYFSAWVFNSGG